jgi:hypothetical protein
MSIYSGQGPSDQHVLIEIETLNIKVPDHCSR